MSPCCFGHKVVHDEPIDKCCIFYLKNKKIDNEKQTNKKSH